METGSQLRPQAAETSGFDRFFKYIEHRLERSEAHRSATNRAEMGLLVQGLAATASKGNVNETFFAIVASRTGKAGYAEGQIRL